MDIDERKKLEALGWPKHILDMMDRPNPAADAVDRMFRDRATCALQTAGCGAIEYLHANAGASIMELAKRLNHGANAIGLSYAIYDEAVRLGVLREISKLVLIGDIREEFPSGWFTDERVHAIVKIGSWATKVRRYLEGTAFAKSPQQIIRHLTIDHPPADGWKPEIQDDPLIDQLFERYWPEESTSD